MIIIIIIIVIITCILEAFKSIFYPGNLMIHPREEKRGKERKGERGREGER